MMIARKIALVLGANALFVAGLAALALWGLQKGELQANDMKDRFEKAQLVATITAETAALGQFSGNTIIARGVNEEIARQISQSQGKRQEALAEFRQRVKTPASMKQGEDLEMLIKENSSASDRISSSLRSGRYADAVRSFEAAKGFSQSIRSKGQEAEQRQAQLTREHDKTRANDYRFIWRALSVGGALAIVMAVLCGVVLTRNIATPLTEAVASLDLIAHGDLSKDAPAGLLAREDEIGILAKAIQGMTMALRKMIQEISGGITVLTSSSAELIHSSTQMKAGSRTASDKAHSVSAAAEEMSSNITSVAAGMEQTTTSLSHLAAAAEQMTSTISEIAQNSDRARHITGEATRQTVVITEHIDLLGVAAREIGKVTETITEISAQTNLLALNATIEAARAGTAGKGFAVVATEIKALARQTAAATEDIRSRISGIQSATTGGITEIAKISQVIIEVGAIVGTIAAAIEQQAATTKEIARNISQASLGVTDANLRVSETSIVSREIAKDIVVVDRTADDMAIGSDHVRVSAGELSEVAKGLRLSADFFIT